MEEEILMTLAFLSVKEPEFDKDLVLEVLEVNLLATLLLNELLLLLS